MTRYFVLYLQHNFGAIGKTTAKSKENLKHYVKSAECDSSFTFFIVENGCGCVRSAFWVLTLIVFNFIVVLLKGFLHIEYPY